MTGQLENADFAPIQSTSSQSDAIPSDVSGPPPQTLDHFLDELERRIKYARAREDVGEYEIVALLNDLERSKQRVQDIEYSSTQKSPENERIEILQREMDGLSDRYWTRIAEENKILDRALSVLNGLSGPFFDALTRQLVIRLVLLGIIRILAGIAKDVPPLLIVFLWIVGAIFVIDALLRYLFFRYKREQLEPRWRHPDTRPAPVPHRRNATRGKTNATSTVEKS